jgi:DNA polymerase I
MQIDMFAVAKEPEPQVDPGNCPTIIDPDCLPSILNHLDRVDTISIDVETTGLDYMRDQLHGIAVSTPDHDWYITGQALPAVLSPLAEIVARPDRLTVGHNLKFDLHFLMRKGIKPARIADTMIAAYLCDENRELGLKPLAHSVLGMEDLPSFGDLLKDAKKKMKAKKMADVSIYDVDLAMLSTYAARDTHLTLKLWDVFQYNLAQESMTDLFWNTEMPFVWTLLDMEENGMHVNSGAVAALRSELEQERDLHLARWKELTGGTVNYNSSRQLGDLLFKKLKLPAQGKTKSGADSVDALTLQRLDPLDGTGTVASLRGIRRVEKLIETFFTMLEEKPFDGYLHGNFNQTGTVTSRLSSSDPNQQNIPSRGELGKKVRTCFDAPDGTDLVVIDYSQIEMRMMANESKDENLLYAFEHGIDVHQMTADRAGVKRSEAKALNFGWGYGMSYIGLMDAIEKAGQPRPSAANARKWLRDYDDAYPTLVKWRNSVIKRARQLGYVPTIAGHRRRLPDLTSTVENYRRAAERQCVNARIQGSCADMLKWAMLQMEPWERMYGAKKQVQVHDELGWRCPKETSQQFAEIASGVMKSIQQQFRLIVPIEAEAGIGSNWAEAK